LRCGERSQMPATTESPNSWIICLAASGRQLLIILPGALVVKHWREGISLKSMILPIRRVRLMGWGDIPHILRIAQDATNCPWVDRNFLTTFQSHETIGYVLDTDKKLVGFAICTVTRGSGAAHAGVLQRIHALMRWLRDPRSRQPWHVRLFGMGVAAGYPRTEIERTLLATLDAQFGRPGDRLGVPVDVNEGILAR
jgi:ribosomal protein S18 acetylase RimI-like enzyme